MTKSIIDDAPFGAIYPKLLLLSSGGPFLDGDVPMRMPPISPGVAFLESNATVHALLDAVHGAGRSRAPGRG
jgi:hypothetical protein